MNHVTGRYAFRRMLLCLSVLTFVGGVKAQILEEYKLIASDASALDFFGSHVAISGGTAIVGASGNDDAGLRSGSAYLFDVNTGAEIAKLTATDAAAFEKFGDSVGISGNRAIVGAHAYRSGSEGPGAAYLFDAVGGAQIAKLTASDGAIGDRFGGAVGIDGDIAIVGAMFDNDAGFASGSAYLFDVGTGLQMAKFTASDAAAGDRFGVSVAMSGSIAIIGAHSDDDMGENSGSAYLFDVTTGVQLAKLTPSDGEANDVFGSSVALTGDIAVVGAHHENEGGIEAGSTYVFDISDPLNPLEIAKLVALDAAADDWFGSAVAVSGDMALIGAYGNDDAGNLSGSAYLFDVRTGQQVAKITASDAVGSDYFGHGLALDGNKAIIGAYGADVGGAAYVFNVPGPATLGLFGLVGAALLKRRRGY